MSHSLLADRSMILTVLGMLLAIAGLWPLQGAAAGLASIAGLSLVYLAGGLPAALRAGGAAVEGAGSRHRLADGRRRSPRPPRSGRPSRVRSC